MKEPGRSGGWWPFAWSEFGRRTERDPLYVLGYGAGMVVMLCQVIAVPFPRGWLLQAGHPAALPDGAELAHGARPSC